MRLLFICTHNRCRSILCEAIAQQRGAGVLQAASAGTAPVAAVHPLTLRFLKARGYETQGLVSQSWEDLQSFAPDKVVTYVTARPAKPAPFGWVKWKKSTGVCPTPLGWRVAMLISKQPLCR